MIQKRRNELVNDVEEEDVDQTLDVAEDRDAG